MTILQAADPTLVQIDHDPDGALRLRFSGPWNTAAARPDLADALAAIDDERTARVVVDAGDVSAWDSAFVSSIYRIHRAAADRDVPLESVGVDPGAERLLGLAVSVPEREGARRGDERVSRLHRIGERALDGRDGVVNTLAFIGETTLSLGRWMTGRARYSRADLALFIQACGADALPIVTLISVLVGVILAFVGAAQLAMFGAQIFIADLVGIGMAVQMGSLMVAIIMAGRTGAAFAAQLGTMQVNEEIDAMRTLGISPFDYLVLPRTLALLLMMPLLALYANLLGMVGGALIGVFLLDISPVQYFLQTRGAVTLTHFAQGIICAAVFSIVIAVAGCMQGIRCGRSAEAVGEATTQAVVQSIVWIVVTDAILTVVFNVVLT